MKDIFNVHTLDLLAVARSFGFSQPPKVVFGKQGKRHKWWSELQHVHRLTPACWQITLNIESKTANVRKAQKKSMLRQSGHAFSAENPYGQRSKGDKRQFAR